MMKKTLFILIVFVFITSNINAQTITGEEIVKKADQVMIGNSAEYENIMVIKRPDLKDIVSKYKTSFKERGKKVMVRILYPPKERGKDLLLIEDNMWQYIPNVERSIRIAGSQRFMGGDFNNSDLLKVSLVFDYTAELKEITKLGGSECYFLILKANKPGVTYDQVNYWVRTKDFVPLKEEYVTLSGKKMKSLVYSDIGELGNRVRPRLLTMINTLRPTHRTIVKLSKAKFDIDLPDSMFTRVYLERKRR